MPLPESNAAWHEALLDLLWRQWCALGVPGHAEAYRQAIVDPEALIVATALHGRREPRLFDEMMEWLLVNQAFVSAQRLKRAANGSDAAGVVAALAGWLAGTSRGAKWQRLAHTRRGTGTAAEPLFQLSDDQPLPVLREPFAPFAVAGYRRDEFRTRGHGRVFAAHEPAALVLKLRAALGLTCRAEILVWLLTHDAGSPTAIARDAGYGQRTVHDALLELRASGLVHVSESGREQRHHLDQSRWRTWLGLADPLPAWRAWGPIFRLLEKLKQALADPKRAASAGVASRNMQSAVWLREIEPLAHAAGLASVWRRLVPTDVTDHSAALQRAATGLLQAANET
jgi:hypothetical protein